MSYPKLQVEKRVMRNSRRNPKRCVYPNCNDPSTHTITVLASYMRGDDECYPACAAHARIPGTWMMKEAREVG